MLHLVAPTPLLVLFNIVIIGALYILTKPALKKGFLDKSRTIVVLCFCFIFCLFSFWGADWFGYLKYFYAIQQGYVDSVSLEYIYKWIMSTFPSYYLFFRAIVWGTSLFFLVQTVKRLQMNLGVVLFFFCCIFLIYFSYARVTLAITMMCYGYSLLWKIDTKSRNYLSFCAGVCLIITSFFFHKSAILGIMAIVVSIIVKKIGRVGPVIVLFSFPLCVLALNVFFSDYFGELTETEDTMGEYARAGSSYLNADNSSGFSGIGTFIQRAVLERLPYFLLAFCCYKEIRSPSVKYNEGISAMIVLLFVIVVTSLVFAFDLGVNTSTVHVRYLRFAQVPACIVLSYFYINNIQVRLVIWTYKIGVFACFYSLFYVLYNSFYY